MLGGLPGFERLREVTILNFGPCPAELCGFVYPIWMALVWGRPLWRVRERPGREVTPRLASLISTKAGVFPHENRVRGNHRFSIVRRARRDGATAGASLSEPAKTSASTGPGPERDCAASAAGNKLRQRQYRQTEDRKVEDRFRAEAAVTTDSRFVAEEHRQCHAGAYQ